MGHRKEKVIISPEDIQYHNKLYTMTDLEIIKEHRRVKSRYKNLNIRIKKLKGLEKKFIFPMPFNKKARIEVVSAGQLAHETR